MKLLYPTSPRSIVSQTFAEHVARHLPNYNGGLDLANHRGTNILAAADGKVTVCADQGDVGYGRHVRIDHGDGYLTIYAHLLDWVVGVGQRVKAGDVIGHMDSTGNSTGDHLHFELRLNNVAIDPASLLVTSLTNEPTKPEPEPGLEPATFPELPRAIVTSTIGLNIRQAAGTHYPTVGWLPKGTVVDVIRGVRDGADTWLQIGYQQFIAMQYQGDELAIWEAA